MTSKSKKPHSRAKNTRASGTRATRLTEKLVDKISEPELTAGNRVGNYEIKALLGRGGMGEVYLAHDSRLDREVALKVLPSRVSGDPKRLQRLRREASAAAALHHPNVCTIYETGDAGGREYISMEYCEGTTLQKKLSGGLMPIDQILDISIQIADALEEARKKNVIHRDIKPSNILIDERNRVKVLDFGLAKKLTDASSGTELKLSQTGIVLGTAAYMSPEQALGRVLDSRTDIFSFGIVLYEMLAGKVPFTGHSTSELLDSILHGDPPPVVRSNTGIPDLINKIVKKMLAKSLDRRYQTASEVWADLRSVKGESTKSVAAGGSRKPRRISSVVALPCKVYGSPEAGYLTDAIPSTLSTILGKVQGLETKIPPTSLEVEKVQGDLAQLSEAYGVGTFVVSSITAESDRMVLNIQLVDAFSRRVLWSNDYEGTRQNYIEMARRAADGVRAAIKPTASKVKVSDRGSNSEAELAFQQGKYYSRRYNNREESGDFDIALASFKRALDLDPKLADAAAEIGILYVLKTESGNPSAETIPEMQKWGERALSINQLCARGYVPLVFAEWSKPEVDAPKALEYCLKGASLEGADPRIQNVLALDLENISLLLSLPSFAESSRLDPLYLAPAVNSGFVYCLLGRGSEGLPLVEKSLRLEPENPVGNWVHFHLLISLGRREEAARLLMRLEDFVSQGRFFRSWVIQAQTAMAIQGDAQLADAQVNELVKIMIHPDTSKFELSNLLIIAPLLVRAKRNEAALQILERGVQADVVPYDFLMLNPDLKGLHSHSGFHEIVSRSRKHFDEMLNIILSARERGEFPKHLENPLQDLLKQLGIGIKP